MRRFFSTSFGSALLGGAVVGALFAPRDRGRLDRGRGRLDQTTTVTTPIAAPVAARDGDEDSNLVNQIYRRDGRRRRLHQSAARRRGHGNSQPVRRTRRRRNRQRLGLPDRHRGSRITNSHVVEGADQVEVTLGSSDTVYDAEIVGTDPATDVAMLEVDAPADRAPSPYPGRLLAGRRSASRSSRSATPSGSNAP